ncbi:MAG: hypothetical protein GY710_24720 [Desulfobacteraceae bacterium]|nr:hypothetical protein [Desulfobacteraceae bacterium]
MSQDVTQPPVLIFQETNSWCFAAAEQMARTYLGINIPTQYEIAYNSLMAQVNAAAPPYFAQWNNASAIDLLANIIADITPGQLAISGNLPNHASSRVNLVKNTYGAFNHTACGGTMSNVFSQANFRAEIEADRIVVIGNAIHYYVVYGYDDRNGFNLKVRDPWPTGVGGQLTIIPYTTFDGWAGKTVIRF